MAVIKGNGFVLRPWRDSDLESLVENANNKKVALNLAASFPHPYTKRDGLAFIRMKRGPKQALFAIDISGKGVGNISAELGKGEYTHVASMGYWLGEKHWGKGIMTKAIREFARHLSEKHGIVRLEATTYLWNRPSQRVLEKNGFKCEGILRKRTLKNGKYVDERMYSKIMKGRRKPRV